MFTTYLDKKQTDIDIFARMYYILIIHNLQLL